MCKDSYRRELSLSCCCSCRGVRARLWQRRLLQTGTVPRGRGHVLVRRQARRREARIAHQGKAQLWRWVCWTKLSSIGGSRGTGKCYSVASPCSTKCLFIQYGKLVGILEGDSINIFIYSLICIALTWKVCPQVVRSNQSTCCCEEFCSPSLSRTGILTAVPLGTPLWCLIIIWLHEALSGFHSGYRRFVCHKVFWWWSPPPSSAEEGVGDSLESVVAKKKRRYPEWNPLEHFIHQLHQEKTYVLY